MLVMLQQLLSFQFLRGKNILASELYGSKLNFLAYFLYIGRYVDGNSGTLLALDSIYTKKDGYTLQNANSKRSS